MNRIILGILFFGLLCITNGENLNGAPSWIFTKDSTYSAVGSSVVIDSDVNFATMEATASARSKIAHQIMTSSLERISMENSSFYKKIEDKIYQIIDGSHPEKMWITKNGKILYVLVEIRKELLEEIHEILEEENINDEKK